MVPRTSLALLFAVLVMASVAATTGGTSHFDVSVSPSVDTPDRTVDFQGTHTLSELGRVDQGEQIHASVEGVSDTDYRVRLEYFDRTIMDERGGDEGPDFTFDTDTPDFSPGSYAVILFVDNQVEDVEPVVVSKFHIDIDAPSSATEGGTIDVEATLEEVEDEKTLERVQVVIGNGDENFREELDHDSTSGSTSTYTGSVDVSSLSTGDYSLYVVAQGTEETFTGNNEVLGASDTQSIEIQAESSNDETNNDGGDGGGGGGDGGGGGGIAPGDGTTTTTEANTTTDTPAETTTEPSTTTDESTSTTTSATDEPTTVPPTTTDDSVIAPNSPTTEPPETASPGQPLGVLPVLLALALVAILARRRQ